MEQQSSPTDIDDPPSCARSSAPPGVEVASLAFQEGFPPRPGRRSQAASRAEGDLRATFVEIERASTDDKVAP